MTYVLNFFGTGIRYWICELPILQFEEMEKIKQQHKVEWENLLFDFDFLKHFGYKHWSELSRYPEQIGFLLLPENRIEIKEKAKFLIRFKAYDLLNSETLFPLFYCESSHFVPPVIIKNTQLLLLIHLEKGLIGKYKIETNGLDINQLKYQLQSFDKYHFLSSLKYINQTLILAQSDTVVCDSKVIFFP